MTDCLFITPPLILRLNLYSRNLTEASWWYHGAHELSSYGQ